MPEANKFRLVGMDGLPHPVLDMPYESIDAARLAAKQWTSTQKKDLSGNYSSIGIEIMTENGCWRTIQYS